MITRIVLSYDQVLSDTLAPTTDPNALTRAAQEELYSKWRGFAPPGTCTLVPLAGTPCADNALGCRVLALCPTMRIPGSVTWHREIVYNCVWALLAAVDVHNARIAAGEPEGDRPIGTIGTVAMTGLATGVGHVSAEMCAMQTALAFAHFHDATRTNPEKWSKLEWKDILEKPLNVSLIAHGMMIVCFRTLMELQDPPASKGGVKYCWYM